MKKLVIGVDLGGTNCRFGVVSEKGDILHQEIKAVPKDKSHKGIIKFLSDNILVLRSKYPKVAGVGVGAPGIVDFDSGKIIRSPHYHEWKGFELKKELSSACGLPVVLDNDANMIAMGEAWLGSAKGLKSFIMVTLGTGIGGGIVANGRVFHGDEGFAGEIGHIVIEFDGDKCDCGGRGCWETYVSIGGLKKLAADKKYATPKILYERALNGDKFAKLVWKKFGAYLGAGIVSLVNVTGTFTYVIGGGISNAWEFFIPEAEREIGKRLYKETSKRVKLVHAKLGESAGILGAAREILQSFRE